jgi:hypothetical protein
MNPTNKKSPGARGIPQPLKQRTGPAHQFQPAIAQLKNALSAQSVKRPVAPPVYRPQARPVVAQAKMEGASQLGRHPATPAVYRPQSVSQVLQKKKSDPRAVPTDQKTRKPVAPPVYRPHPPPRCLQTKAALSAQTPKQTHPINTGTADSKLGQQPQGTFVPAKKTPALQPAISRPPGTSKSFLARARGGTKSKVTSGMVAQLASRPLSRRQRGVVQKSDLSALTEQREADRTLFEPSNHKNPTETDFEHIRDDSGISVSDLMDLIPQEVEDTYVGLLRTVRGFKFEWQDDAGTSWEVWGHEPDAGAAAGHAGAAGWTVRIRHGTRYLMSEYVDPPVGEAYNWGPASTPARVRMSHITLTGVS